MVETAGRIGLLVLTTVFTIVLTTCQTKGAAVAERLERATLDRSLQTVSGCMSSNPFHFLGISMKIELSAEKGTFGVFIGQVEVTCNT